MGSADVGLMLGEIPRGEIPQGEIGSARVWKGTDAEDCAGRASSRLGGRSSMAMRALHRHEQTRACGLGRGLGRKRGVDVLRSRE